MKTILTGIVAAVILLAPLKPVLSCSAEEVQFNVSIGEMPAALIQYQPQIEEHIRTAARTWTSFVDAKPCTAEISFSVRDVVEGDPKKLGFGKSKVTASFGKEKKNDKIVAEQGWATLLRTGKHPAGSKPDIVIELQSAYVMREFWWDPDPVARRVPVPRGKLDAQSVLLHELGHALAFNGWIDPNTAQLNGTHMSTYDQWVTTNGPDFYFVGPTVLQVYGRPLVLARTATNYHHVGEERPGVRMEVLLQSDLMTGYHFQWGRRYSISPLDIAILKDCGIPLKK